MFSTTIATLTKLNEEELAELKSLEARINQVLIKADNLAQMGQSIKLVSELGGSHFPPKKVLKFCANSAIFKNFFEDQSRSMFENIALLKAEGYLGAKVDAVDRTAKSTILGEYIGSYLLKEYMQTNNDFYLDEACKLNVFAALLMRTDKNVTKIKQNSDVHFSTLELDKDLNLLGNTYWSVGHMHAAFLYLDLGNYYQNKGTDRMAAALDFHKKSAKSFFCAAKLYLMDAVENEKVMSLIFKDQKLEEVYGFKNMEEARNFILKPFANDMAVITHCADQATRQIDNAIATALSHHKPIKVRSQ